MKINQIASLIAIFIILDLCSAVWAFPNKTHKAISEKAVISSQVDAYLDKSGDTILIS
jgi:hypothetical protein